VLKLSPALNAANNEEVILSIGIFAYSNNVNAAARPYAVTVVLSNNVCKSLQLSAISSMFLAVISPFASIYFSTLSVKPS